MVPNYKSWKANTSLEKGIPFFSNSMKITTSILSFADELNVMSVSKRKSIWEPIFIGTKNDPPYDERLSWEGKRDKMTQAYLFCLLDYNFAILDNAFLIHKPGIKTKKEKLKNIKPGKLANQNKFIKKIVLPELKLMYGKKKGCYIP